MDGLGSGSIEWDREILLQVTLLHFVWLLSSLVNINGCTVFTLKKLRLKGFFLCF